MTRDDIIRMAREAGLIINSPYLVPHDHVMRGIERLVALAQTAERNKLAAWMMAQGYATGHGDTMEQLLEEFKRGASFDKAELWIKRINDAVAPLQERIQDLYSQLNEAERELDSQYKLGMEVEREQCAKVCDLYTDSSSDHEAGTAINIQDAIRARGAIMSDDIMKKASEALRYVLSPFTHPPQRTWVGLSDAELERLIHNFGSDPHTLLDEVNARLRAKNR